MGSTRRLNKNAGGSGDLTIDAWGTPKVSTVVSLFHGLFTYDVPRLIWLVEEDGVEIAADSITSCVSSGGGLLIDSTGFSEVRIHSHRNPRYQPNRGHLYSTAVIIPDPNLNDVRDWGLFSHNNGVFFRLVGTGTAYTLYAVRRSGDVDNVEEITLPDSFAGFDISKGQIYDIQFQWRGTGFYNFFIGNPNTGHSELVHTMDLLGTLTTVSIENPALPAAYRVDNTNGTNPTLISGCVDISSENGTVDRLQYSSTTATRTLGSNAEEPVLSLYNPTLIGTQDNTRDMRLVRVSGTSDSNARVLFEVYKSRNPAALTGEAFVPVGNGSYYQKDTTATAVVLANMVLIQTFKTPANETAHRDNPDMDRIDFFITHGDYVIVTATGLNGNVVIVTIEVGEEI